MISKEQGKNGKVRVTFSMPASIWADTIHLVGDFNNWNPTATPLKLDETRWSVSLELDANQMYEYRYLVNNTDWTTDWNNDSARPCEQRGDTSVVFTGLPYHPTNGRTLRISKQLPVTVSSSMQNPRKKSSIR